jgi:hypothetical protein
VPYLDRLLARPAYRRWWPGGLVDDEAVGGHRVPGHIDGRDVEFQPSRYL